MGLEGLGAGVLGMGGGGFLGLGGLGVIVNAEVFLGNALELPALKLGDGGDGVHVHGLGQEEHLMSLL